MLPRNTNMIVGFISTALFCTFIIGMSWSISTGLAGFWRGLPFAIVALIVMALAWYDYYDQCVRKSAQDDSKK